MNTLFIDTHGDFIFLAIYKNDKILIEKEIYEKKDHSTVCFPTLVGLLSDANLDIPASIITFPYSYITDKKSTKFTLSKFGPASISIIKLD